MSDHELRVSKIRNGTVLDHLPGGSALTVLALLGIGVSVAMNVPSERLGTKDVVKVEERELSQEEVDVLSLIAPRASVNIVQEYEVAEKNRLERPDSVEGVLSCPNSNCITNAAEPVQSQFAVLDDGVRCEYCTEILRADIASHLQTQ